MSKTSGGPTSGARHGRDTVVVGASEGGIEALSTFVAGLPAELPAAVFVAVHSRPGIDSRLPELLTRRGPLRARPRLVAEPPGPEPEQVPIEISELEGDEPGVAAELVCPICQGKLTETIVGGFSSFRCHVGHSFSLESVAAEQAEEVERALWASVRALEETGRLSGRLSASTTGETKVRFAEKADTRCNTPT